MAMKKDGEVIEGFGRVQEYPVEVGNSRTPVGILA
jgi:hypothetical protein